MQTKNHYMVIIKREQKSILIQFLIIYEKIHLSISVYQKPVYKL